MRALVLAEKPSVGRDIARVLGCREKGEGFLAGEQYVVTWAIGHLVALQEPDELDPAYKKWRMDSLPILPERIGTKILPKTKSQFQIVKKLLNDRGIDRVICATDSGREGELIFRYIYDLAGCKKPVDRLWISSMTDQAIREGFEKLRPDGEYDPLYAGARCRSEADWLVGMNATRAFTLRYDTLLSLGRVQTPTLKMVVERDREIAQFVPKDYYEIRANFGDYEGLWRNPETKDGRCPDKERALAIKAAVSGQTGAVTESARERKRIPPPMLFDLTSLQREANKRCGFSAKKTLDIAQSLYERHKLVTYPRTDSRALPRDMAGKIRQALSALPGELGEFARPLLPEPPRPLRVYDDARVSDHHAIVPTGGKPDTGRLTSDEARIFDMVARRLVAAHYPDYEYEAARLVTRVGEHDFLTSGATPLVEGWRALYREEKKENEPAVPRLEIGETRPVKSVKIQAKKTKPPEPHTDASLLAAMERAGRALEDEALKQSLRDSGLGTPATRAAILERLIEVRYLTRRGKTLRATEKGARLIEVAPSEITSAEMTGKWERALNEMARTRDPERLRALSERFLQSIRRYAAFLVEAARRAEGEGNFPPEERRASAKAKVQNLGAHCPLCQTGTLTENSRAYGCSRWREGCKFTVWKDAVVRAGGPPIDRAMLKALLTSGEAACPGGKIVYRDGAVRFVPAAGEG